MTKKYQLQFSLWLVVLALSAICAQAQTAVQPTTNAQSRTPLVSATATAEQVRFASPGEIIQMRLEVFAAGGERLFDSDFKFGNLLDWPVQDQQGQRLPDGAYLCTVTIKDLAGDASRKYGTAVVQAGQVSLSPPEPERLSDGQRQVLETGRKSQAPGTEASNDYFTILPEGTAIPITTLAHDGNNGQLTTSVGALSFRAGDFFAGKNVERMRLTADGNLGVGVEDPKAKLDVAGTIKTGGGIVFPDGTVQTTAFITPSRNLGQERDRLQRDAQDRTFDSKGESNTLDGSKKNLRLTPNIGGTGTTGKIAKWLDNVGTLGDSVISELSGRIGIGTASPGEKLAIGYGANTDIAIGSASGNKVYIGSYFNNMALAINRRVSDGNFANPGLPTASIGLYTSSGDSSVRFGTSNTNNILDTERMRIDKNGNVGIGTTNPAALLHLLSSANPTVMRIQSSSAFGSGRIEFRSDPQGSANEWRPSFIQSTDNGNFTGGLAFFVNGSGFANKTGIVEVMRLVNGNTGIGTTAPSEKLHVNGTGIVRARVNSDSNAGVRLALGEVNKWSLATYNQAVGPIVFNNFQIYNETTGQEALRISEGNAITVTGNLIVNGTFSNPSDLRLKRNIVNLNYGLREVMQLRPVTWFWKEKNDGKLNLGLIAQEAESIIPELVQRGNDAEQMRSINYLGFVPVVIKAIQEQQTDLNRKNGEITNLHKQNAELSARITALEQVIQEMRRQPNR